MISRRRQTSKVPRLPDKDEREEVIAKALRGCNRKLRKRLRAEIGSPPDINNISPSLWAELEKDQEDCLASVLLLAYIASGTGLGLTVGLKSQELDGLRERGQIWADSVSRDVSQKMTTTTRKRLEKVSQRHGVGEATPKDVDEVIISTTSDERAEGVATTETTRAQTAGEVDAADVANDKSEKEAGSGPGAGKKAPKILVAKWVHESPPSAPWNPPFHPCPVCRDVIGLTADKWPAAYALGPPQHVNCDCWLKWQTGDPSKQIARSPFTGIPADLVR